MDLRNEAHALIGSRRMTQPVPFLAIPDSAPCDTSPRAAEVVRQAPSLFVQVLETIRDPLFILDREWRFTYVNRHALTEADQSLEDFLGQTLWDKNPHWLGGTIEAQYRRAMTDQTAVHFEAHEPRFGRWCAMHAYPAPEGLIVHVQELTDPKRDAEAAHEPYQTLQSLIHASPLAIIALDSADKVTMWNPAAEHIFGWLAEEVLGRPLPFIPPDKQQEYQTFRAEEMRGEARSGSEVRRLRKDGNLVDISIWTAPVRDSQGSVRSTIGILADVSERKRAQQQLQESSERLRELSRRLLEVQELERRHLARELHDEIGQILTGLQFSLETSLRLEGDDLRASLSESQRLVKDLTARVRDLSLRLRPTMLDDLGLLPALLWHLERYTAQTKIHVGFEHRGLDRRLYPPEVETAAYRIIQEALTNIARHAGVREATVRLWRDRDRLVLHIDDKGRGFDSPAVLSRDRSSGLSGMRERAVLLGGHLTVASVPGEGTSVNAELPFQGLQERRRRGLNSGLG
jgi:PAS domain S-box-containing protein